LLDDETSRRARPTKVGRRLRFEQLLSRADDEVLQELLGQRIVRLLNLLDPTLARPARLRDLVTSFSPAEQLLRNPEARRSLLELLPRSEATDLVEQLQLPTHEPYAALRDLRIKKGSSAEATLFRFFAVVPNEFDEPARAAAVTEQSAHYELFAHQRLASRNAQLYLDNPPHRVLLHMPTGSGKTRTAMHIIARELRRREPCVVVWLAFSEELCEQAASEFQSAWSSLGDRPLSVFRFWGQRSVEIEQIDDGFVVAGLAKTYQAARRSIDFIVRLADRSSLTIIDEAHQAIAESYRFVLEILVERNSGSRLLGLTATPGRTWNEPDRDRELADFFFRQKVTLQVEGYASPVDYLIDEGYLARPIFESLAYTAAEPLSPVQLRDLADSLDVPEELLASLAEDEQRNLLVLSRIEQLAGQHQRIMVFAASVGHARTLATILKARGLEADAVTSNTPPAERARVIAKFRSAKAEPVVLCNYGVLTTGFDAPRTSAAVIARPTKSLVLYSQMVGRATRGPLAGGNAEARIVTVVDTNLPGFGEMSEAFRNWEDVW
jgi:DNA repair protein RadD